MQVIGNTPEQNYVNPKDQIQRRKSKLDWTQEEDNLLLQLAQEYNDNWNRIATYLQGRTVRQCRDRYVNTLDPNINRKKFTFNEDKLLLQKVYEFGPQW